MYDAHAPFLSQHLPTMPVWWLSGHDTTWWTRSMTVERGATYRGRAMGGTPRPWPKPCRFIRILCAPCTSLEGRTLLPHWIEESFPSPKSCAAQIQRTQGGGGVRGSVEGLVSFTEGTNGWGTGPVNQTTSQKSLISTSCPTSLSPSCHIWP